MTGAEKGRRLALALSGGLLGGAYISEYIFGLYPCEMCWWQRWPHFAALGFLAVSYLAPPPRFWTALAAVAIFISGLIGAYHAGVEYKWWAGITGCATIDFNLDVMDPAAVPIVRCDEAPWSLFGISLAGFNFLFSCIGAMIILNLSLKRKRRVRV